MIVERVDVPIYLSIAGKARQLQELGMNAKAIATALGVSDKTVAKAVAAAVRPDGTSGAFGEMEK